MGVDHRGPGTMWRHVTSGHLLLILTLAHITQGQVKKKDEEELLPEGIKCYTCGLEIYQADYEKLRENVPDLPKWLESQVIQDKVKKNYNMDMWIRQCDRGILSCYIAQGFYDFQEPMFRGCAGNFFPHDEKCTTQQQAVTF